MKSRTIAILLSVSLASLSLTACGSKEDTEETVKETAEATEEDIEAAGFTDGSSNTEDEAEDAGNTEESEDTEDADEKSEEASEDGAKSEEAVDADGELTGIHHAEINIKDYGTIEVELDADTAPVTVTNFVNLAEEGFYDGLTFWRIIDGFMIQGGDPLGNGTGGSDETIKGEFSNNGVENDISHTRGTISMARATDPDSASSQFFIVQADSEFLDGDYAAFGHVTEGMDIVDQICADAEPTDDNGTIDADEQPVIESITILD